MDPNLRNFLKSFPWIGIAATGVFAVLFSIYLSTGRIKVLNSKQQGPYYIDYADRPTDYLIIVSLMAVAIIGLTYYCVFRFRTRKQYLKEDEEH